MYRDNPDAVRATPEQMQRKHMFVVNGSPDFLSLVRELLQGEQFNVTTTNFVPLSFKSIEAAEPALLIIDLVIGEAAGWDLLAELRAAATTRDFPVLLISSSPELLDRAIQQHEAFGGDRYLDKPLDIEDLLAVVADMVGPA